MGRPSKNLARHDVAPWNSSMERILLKALKWIGKKLLVLALIIAVMIGAFWLQDHWKDIEALKRQLVEAEGVIEGRRAELDRLRAQLDAAAAKVTEELGTLRDLKSVSEGAAAAEKIALDHLEQLKKEKSLKDYIPKLPTVWKGDFAVAEGVYEKSKEATSAAKAAEVAFGAQLDDTEAGKLQKQVTTQEAEVAAAEQEVERLDAIVNGDWLERLRIKAVSVLPSALGVLAGIIFAPIFIKIFLFFVVAPQASRIRPVRIFPLSSDPPAPSAVASANSLPIEVGPDQELLIHPDFLLSSSKPARKRTRYFLNPTLPFSSLASGMVMLTSIRPEGEQPTKVEVSATKDLLCEVGIVELPEGASMVLQPRGLAGVRKPAAGFTRISRHWRLLNLHSWMTLQLRYLVFHGPCTVILKGHCGVRAKCPDPANPQIINQSATLGFSSHLDYSNTRCETFWSYFNGKEDLFNDLFAGESGLYVYEVKPAAGKKAGIGGGGLEGLLDGFLKVFGI